jgi:hypothetical protein
MSYRRVPIQRKNISRTLAQMKQQLDSAHDMVCEDIRALLADVNAAAQIVQGEPLTPEAALACVRDLLRPWASGQRVDELHVHVYALQAFWQQDLASLHPTVQGGASHQLRMADAREESRRARSERKETRHARWLAEAQKCLDTNPKWSNWAIATHLEKQFRKDPDFGVTVKTIYNVLQKHLPRR